MIVTLSLAYFFWVAPGPSRIPDITVADQVAKEVALLLPVPNLPVPMTDFTTAVKSKVKRHWQSSWGNQSLTNKA